MKNKVKIFILVGVAHLLINSGIAQTRGNQRPTLTILSIDINGLKNDPLLMGNLVRTELEKLDTFDVMDRYDVAYMVEKNKLSINNCYGKLCLTEIGETIQSDKMLSGSIEQYPKTIIYILRLIDVKSKSIERTTVMEFLNLPEELQAFTNITVRTMFNKSVDQNVLTKLTQRNSLDNTLNNPKKERLRLDGPRLGFVTYTGNVANIIQADKSSGGFEAFPVMFQFGYQFEKQYLNEGKIQALFEFVPMVTGVDQGYFIPGFSLLHGLRSNVNGWEFALGPTLNLSPKSKGYYDETNTWHREQEWMEKPENKDVKNPFQIKERLDSRGDYALQTGFVLAFGRTFKSGKLNLPVNIYVIPNKDGFRIGASLGFNAKNK
ncbi:MAG: hypothetical protein K0S53_707 [Bacteroidetes bacterium]|jgi:hypothetical protein|nr:hypothetical protein [Bacteroidota bacterium]